jgi:excinuclease UvrABC nuclease subunit
MREYAKDLKFEKAQELKEILSGLRSLTEYQ